MQEALKKRTVLDGDHAAPGELASVLRELMVRRASSLRAQPCVRCLRAAEDGTADARMHGLGASGR